MIRRNSWLLLVSGLVLAGCSNEVENAQETVSQMAAAKEAIIVSLNAIQQKEAEMQSQFDEALNADEELVSFKNGTASVFENIKLRQEEITTLEEDFQDFKNELEDLNTLDFENIPLKEIQALQATSNDIVTHIEAYLPSYKEQLQEEVLIFESLGEDEAHFDTLYSGVAQLNQLSETNLTKLEPLIDQAKAFDSNSEKVSAALLTETDK